MILRTLNHFSIECRIHLLIDGWMDGWLMDGWMDGLMDGRTDWLTDWLIDRLIDWLIPNTNTIWRLTPPKGYYPVFSLIFIESWYEDKHVISYRDNSCNLFLPSKRWYKNTHTMRPAYNGRYFENYFFIWIFTKAMYIFINVPMTFVRH